MELIIAGLAAVLLTPVAARIARRSHIVDRPGPLKLHDRPIPYLGGLAVFLAMAGPIAFWHPLLLVPLGISTVLGLLDDVADLSARSRLACEAGNGVIVAAVVLPSWQPFGALLAVVAVVGLVNAVNLIDGLDGLAAGVGAAAAFGFAIVMEGGGRMLALALLGGLLGFLVWNRPPAQIYLGDSGSYLIGTALAILFVATTIDAAPNTPGVVAVLFVAVPLADAGVAMFRRWRSGAPLLHGDRAHIYDQLVVRGLSSRGAAAVCVAAQIILVGVGLVIGRLPTVMAHVATSVSILVIAISMLWAFTTRAAAES